MQAKADTDGEKCIVEKDLIQLSNVFKSDYQCDWMCAFRRWKQRSSYMELVHHQCTEAYLSTYSQHYVRHVNLQAVSASGRKRSKGMEDLYAVLFAEFERMKACEMKMSPSVMRKIVLAVVKSVTEEGTCHREVTVDQNPTARKVTYRWVHSFTQFNDPVICAQTGKLR